VVAVHELFHHLEAAVLVDLPIALRILESVVAGELVDVVEFDLALAAVDAWGEVLVEDGAVVAQGLAARQGGDFVGFLVDAPGLHVLVLVQQRTHTNCHFYFLPFLHLN
jgi:hypothetical protein